MTSKTQLRICHVIALLLFLTVGAWAQTNEYHSTDGTTSPGIQPGSPAGSYALSDFASIDLYTGKLNFNLPLIKAGGRGKVSHSISLRIQQNWHVEVLECDVPDCGSFTRYFTPIPNWWVSNSNKYLPGQMLIRHSGVYTQGTCPTSAFPADVMTRLTFVDQNGAEMEFVDTNADGEPKAFSSCGATGYNRGTTWRSVDGQSATFISNSAIYDQKTIYATEASGTLILRDGTRYTISAGRVTEIKDTNGNKISFSYDGSGRLSSVTDALNRSITLTYYSTYDVISFKGTGGTSRSIEVHYDSLANVLRSGSTQSYEDLFPSLDGGPTTYNPTMVKEVRLPNYGSDSSSKYSLLYDSYGNITRVTLPTGGGYEFDWTYEVLGLSTSRKEIRQNVTEQRIYANGIGSNYTTKIVFTEVGAGGWSRKAETFAYGAGSPSSTRIHRFSGNPFVVSGRTELPPFAKGKEIQTEVCASGSTVTQQVEHTWANRANYSWWGGTSGNEPANDPVITYSVTTLLDVSPNLISKVEYSYDSYNNVTSLKEYDWGSGSVGSLARETTSSYATTINGTNYATDTSVHIRNLVSQRSLYSSSTERSRTAFEYDNYTPGTYHAALVSRSNVSQWDSSNYGTSWTKRGNATKTTQSLFGGTDVNAYIQYDVLGNEVKLIDGRGKATTKTFSDCFGAPNGNATTCTTPSELSGLSSFALVSSTTNAISQTSYTQYEYYTGFPVDAQDVSGSVTSTYYDDDLERPTKVVGPTNLQVFFTYDPTNKKITTEQDQSSASDKNLKTVAKYDGLGRTWRTGKYNGSTWELVDVEFEENGWTKKRSNPFTNSSPDSGSPSAWTTITFDGMGRTLSATTPDSAVASTSYSGNVVTLTDQAGKKKKEKTDALGRLIEVIEDPDTLAYSTTYLYTVFDKPYKATQGSQNRYWLYDSLGRVIADRKPEQAAPHSITDSLSGNNSWSNKYIYNANSQLEYVYDARNKEKGWSFDDLGRITAVGYPNSNTPGSAFSYDSATNGTGRLAFVETYNVISGTNSYSKLTIDIYDAAGRVTKQTQSFLHGGTYKNYVVEQTYNRAGQITQVKYPSGRTADYSWNVAGRLSSMSGNLGGTSKTYISATTYNAAGQRLRETWGTDTTLYLNKHYNNRLQMYDIRLGTSSSDEWEWNRGALRYYYASNYAWGDGGTNNNGNLYRGEHFVPIDAGVSEWMISTDYYSYDALNRLSDTTEIKEEYINNNYSSSQVFKQVNLYDRYGNRTIDQSNSSGSINMAHFDVDDATNRLEVPSGGSGTITYDDAGNLIFDSLLAGGGSSNRVYDNNQRLEKTYDTGSEIMHVFDHADRRVRRRFSNDNQTWYVYGIQGELLAYYDKNSTTPLKEYAYKDGAVFIIGEGSTMKWCVTDHLNSIRMIVSSDGSLSGIERHDYAPFGEELLAGVGSRTTGRGYLAGGSGGITFTGHERDIDTGLDYFGARFHHNVPGRFTSVDPAEGSLSLGNPQSFNRYSYVLNSPMILIDPDGRKPRRDQTLSRVELNTLLTGLGRNIREEGRHRAGVLNERMRDNHIAAVYNKSLGFVDIKHFIAAAAIAIAGRSDRPNASKMSRAKDYILGSISGMAAIGAGEAFEGLQMWGGVFITGPGYGNWGFLRSTEFGPALKMLYKTEDTVGNVLGAMFAYYYYDPEGQDIEDQIANFFEDLGIEDPRTLPESVFEPNWQQIVKRLANMVQELKTHKDKK